MIFLVLIRFGGNRLPRHAILFTDPLAKVHEFAAFRTKRAEGIILPMDRLITGRALFHDPNEGAV